VYLNERKKLSKNARSARFYLFVLQRDHWCVKSIFVPPLRRNEWVVRERTCRQRLFHVVQVTSVTCNQRMSKKKGRYITGSRMLWDNPIPSHGINYFWNTLMGFFSFSLKKMQVLFCWDMGSRYFIGTVGYTLSLYIFHGKAFNIFTEI
jgi:hypothetical protein